MALVGIDVGGTGVKAVAYSADGKILSYAYREYDMLNPRPGVYEFSPQVLLDSAMAVLKQVTFGCGQEVLAIGCSSFGESFICFDENDNILCNSIMYFDTRGEEDVAELGRICPPEKYRKISGSRPSRIKSLIKMRVMNREDPGFFERVKKIHFLPDFVLSRIGGGHFCDYSIADTTAAFNIFTDEWVPGLFEWAGVNPAVLPEPIPVGAIMGEVPAAIAAEIGVKPGAKLVSGGHDHTAASLGVGMSRPGQMMNEIGTVDTMMLLSDDLSRLTAPESPINFKPHATPGNFSASGGNLTGGVLLKWFRDHLGRLEKAKWEAEGHSFYSEYDKLIPPEPTDLIVLPRFSTGASSKEDLAGILNLTLSTTNEQIYRAFMEGEAYEMYTQFKHLNRWVSKVDRIIALGGGANCDAYMQIRSDVFNVPVITVNTQQAGTHGDAMLAGIAVGVYEDIEQAISTAVSIRKIFEPHPETHEYYMGMYEKYQRVYKAVAAALWPQD